MDFPWLFMHLVLMKKKYAGAKQIGMREGREGGALLFTWALYLGPILMIIFIAKPL